MLDSENTFDFNHEEVTPEGYPILREKFSAGEINTQLVNTEGDLIILITNLGTIVLEAMGRPGTLFKFDAENSDTNVTLKETITLPENFTIGEPTFMLEGSGGVSTDIVVAEVEFVRIDRSQKKP